ncbi:hypothetical protein BC829DRAFT_421031 [Chytridium lagenaria]|nr:hypothetical protein BC829DRAFT_421031 [Chytridium lagenaria]
MTILITKFLIGGDCSRMKLDAEVIVDALKKRHSRPKGYRGDSDHVAEHMLLPSVNDPSLWLVKCRQGRERDLVMQLMRKYCELEYRDKLEIISAFSRENIIGYIYIEARKLAHVQKAIEGINGLNANSIKVVPIDDMVSCLKIKSKEKEVKEGMWVRVKKGKYGGDLAKVLELVDSNSSARVRLVPRIDFASLDKRRADVAGMKRKKFGGPSPPQKLFNPDDFKGLSVARWKGMYVFQDEYYDRDGFLEKEMKVASLETENVNPTLEEIGKFSTGSAERNAELNMMAAQQQLATDDFMLGENVEVIRGEMKDICGKVLSIDNGIVTIVPPSETKLAALKFDAKDLRKKFDEGDHVKVIYGMHNGETGLIIKILNNIVTILSDTSLKPIDVFAKDLRAATDVSSGNAAQEHMMFRMRPQEVGVVVKVEKDVLTVLNHFGTISKLRAQQIVRKLDRRRALASDCNGKPVGAGDSVVVSDPSSGVAPRRATVIHIHRSFIFVLSREVMENGGIFVTKSSNVNLMTGSGMKPNSGGLDGAPGFKPPLRTFAPMGGRGRGRGRDPLISKTVTIIQGPYKGYIGIVKDMTDNGARVELHTSQRIVTIPVDRVKIHGSSTENSQSSDFNFGSRYASNYRYGEGSATPMHPLAGGRTPMHSGGSKTPMHRPNGGMTPNPYQDGSRTPAWDSGSRTPAHSGSRTPAWEAGSRTPARDGAWDAGSKTPARSGYSDFGSTPFQSALAGTPRDDPETPYNPSTPHQYGSGIDGSTPYNPQTPGYSSSIPHTPGMGGGRDGDGGRGDMGYYPNPSSVPNTGGGGAGPNTPFNPATPFNPTTPYPSTPHASGAVAQDDLQDWLHPHIEVKIRRAATGLSFENGTYDNQRCVVRSVENARRARVVLGGGEISVPIENMEPVKPEKKSSLTVIAGEFKGQNGVLIGTDVADGIVRLNAAGSDFRIIPLKYLAKHVE